MPFSDLISPVRGLVIFLVGMADSFLKVTYRPTNCILV
jgi:hypothetical protein